MVGKTERCSSCPFSLQFGLHGACGLLPVSSAMVKKTTKPNNFKLSHSKYCIYISQLLALSAVNMFQLCQTINTNDSKKTIINKTLVIEQYLYEP